MTYEPLAERLRPRTLDDYIGQRHLVGEGAVIVDDELELLVGYEKLILKE